MCNLYNVGSKDELAIHLRAFGHELLLPDLPKATVGPFDTGWFLRPGPRGWMAQAGQWGLIRPGQPERIDRVQPKAQPGKKPPAPRPRSTNNARLEGIETKPTFKAAWRSGQRCLIPMAWYQEPNWETGKNLWWHLRHADGLPWMVAGLWSEWTDPTTGELVPNFTALTVNCNDHPLLSRLHKPEVDPHTRQPLPWAEQDKRSLVHIEPAHWQAWAQGDIAAAKVLLVPAPLSSFDLAVTVETDQCLAAMRLSSPASQQLLI